MPTILFPDHDNCMITVTYLTIDGKTPPPIKSPSLYGEFRINISEKDYQAIEKAKKFNPNTTVKCPICHTQIPVSRVTLHAL